jgi:hypothetical protein
LAKMAKALGYQVWGLPNYLIFHIIWWYRAEAGVAREQSGIQCIA